jgi:hypothetical protein
MDHLGYLEAAGWGAHHREAGRFVAGRPAALG